MYLHEMPVNSKIKLSVKVAKQVIEFDTTIIDKGLIEKKSSCAVCSLIRVDGKILNLGHYMLQACVKNADNNRDYKYTISNVVIDRKNRVMKLYSGNTVKAQNYRNAFRVPCSYKAVIRIGDNRKTVDGYTHDISYTGASYIFTTDKSDVSVGDVISASIYDTDVHNYKTIGKVVHIIDDFAPDLTLIGVQFEKTVDLQKFVNKLQLRELKVRHDDVK